MSRFLKVEGKSNLVRDKVSGAILNINTNEASQSRRRKKVWQEEKEKTQRLAADVDILKEDVNEIKSLLNKLLEVTNGSHHN